jgi:hypothetical protein
MATDKKDKKLQKATIRQKTDKLFEDLGTLANEKAPADSQKKGKKRAAKTPSPAKDQDMELRREVTLLRARLQEFEEQKKEAPKLSLIFSSIVPILVSG